MANFEPSCREAYAKVFSDGDTEDWCVLGYNGRKLASTHCAAGGLEALKAVMDDSQVQYALLRLSKTDDGGDCKRVKFVFITWVGEHAPAMKKGQVTGCKSSVGDLFKGYHIEKQLYERSELEGLEALLDADLKKAAGANYDMGNINSGVKSGGTSSMKQQSKSFFEAKDKETKISGVVFQGHISNKKEISACDLGGRSMTASASEAKRNTVGYTAPTVQVGEEVTKEDAPAPAGSASVVDSSPVASPARLAASQSFATEESAAEEAAPEPEAAEEEATLAEPEAAPEPAVVEEPELRRLAAYPGTEAVEEMTVQEEEPVAEAEVETVAEATVATAAAVETAEAEEAAGSEPKELSQSQKKKLKKKEKEAAAQAEAACDTAADEAPVAADE